MASNNFMQRVGHSSCIRCDFETDDAMSFVEQDAAMMAHLADKHPNWHTEKLTPEQERRLAARWQDPRDKRIEELEADVAKFRREIDLRVEQASALNEDKERFKADNAQLRAENERLIGCLEKANEQTEHFEREWYLCGDELEKLKQPVSDAEIDALLLDANSGIHTLRDRARIGMEKFLAARSQTEGGK
jgi:chromosome segregation ATPase